MNHFSAQIQPATPMQEITHPELVSALRKAPEEYQPSSSQLEMAHFALGVAGEAGEVVDHVKKHVFNGKNLDFADVVKEMGDLEWYLEALRQCLGLTRDYILAENTRKLTARYPGLHYSDAAAQARLDEVKKAF